MVGTPFSNSHRPALRARLLDARRTEAMGGDRAAPWADAPTSWIRARSLGEHHDEPVMAGRFGSWEPGPIVSSAS